ncbi:M23 family metallopeptidase [Mycoplasmatota bacterium WC44]
MKRIAGVYLILAMVLLISACSDKLLTISVIEENETSENIDTNEKEDDKGEDEVITEVPSYNEIEFIDITGTFINGEVVLKLSISNEDKFQINSLQINGETYNEFESNNDNTEMILNIDEGLNVGNKLYELNAIYYGNDIVDFEEIVVEDNTVDITITYNINGYEFLQIPQFPMDYVRVTAVYHSKSYYNYYGVTHKGIDMGGADGGYGNDEIFSIADGEVVHISNSSTAGKYIVIKHDNLINGQTVISRYLHLDKYEDFSIGDTIQKGQLIGIEGKTGKVDGAHLHFEMWIAPPGYDYYYYDITYYAVDPNFYLFVDDFQTLSTTSLEEEIIKIK